jgi:hypothetical protein
LISKKSSQRLRENRNPFNSSKRGLENKNHKKTTDCIKGILDFKTVMPDGGKQDNFYSGPREGVGKQEL